ncbi:MAG: ABC transporter permease [Caulobacteraceae bacterium]
MLRSYLSAALGNLGRNWLYGAITVLGLAVSFAAAILIGLYVRDEFTFERFIPGHERIYRLESDVILPGQGPRRSVFTNGRAAGYLKLDFPEVEAASRLAVTRSELKVGSVAGTDAVIWADPDFFELMAYPALAGDLRSALQAPDGVVLTRAAARRLFGQDAPVGRILQVNPAMDFVRGLSPDETRSLTSDHPMRVLAVLKDPPSNTHLKGEIFASGRAAFSAIALDDRHAPLGATNVLTYVKLKPGARVEALSQRLARFGQGRYPGPGGAPSPLHFGLIALPDVHFTDAGLGPSVVLRPSADRKVDAGIGGVGILVVVIAALNFVALTNARGARRAVEVGVRKATGARRSDLVVQFMGEAALQVTIAMVMGVALADMALGPVNAFLGRTLRFDYVGDPSLAAALVGGALLTAFLAGLYPALALSAYRPALALKGGGSAPVGAGRAQQVMVVCQFGILIGLIVMTATVYRQTTFAVRDSLRMDISQTIWMAAPCRTAFAREAAAVQGVKAVSCTSREVMQMGMNHTTVLMPDRSEHAIAQAALDAGYLELQGIAPVAGRLFSRGQGEDMVLDRRDPSAASQPSVILNESGARELGYASPQDAVGKIITWVRFTSAAGAAPSGYRPSRVVGVVPDFSFASIRVRVPPTIYYVDPAETSLLVMKLDGRAIPETLTALRRLWAQTGHDRPPGYVFESAMMDDLYRDVILQGVVVAVCAGLAISIAGVGLFSLAAFTTEQRTKEIGVRKAMGARTVDIVQLLLWRFTQPVLLANLIAWPAAFWAMDRWLSGFAYRVDLPPWLFLAASAAGVLIAWATVSAHTILVARAKPAAALRYE